MSSSYQDVTNVAPKTSAADSSVQLATRTKLQRASATELLDGQGARSRACQEHENELAEIVIVCEPEGTSLMMGGLHPRASLYERPVNLDAAKAAHAEFRRVMRESGVKVIILFNRPPRLAPEIPIVAQPRNVTNFRHVCMINGLL